MDLSPTTTTTAVARQKLWLGSSHGTDSTDSVTLDLAGGSFAAVRIDNGNGTYTIPSGTAIVKSGTTYDRASGAAVADGHLYEDVIVRASTVNAGGAMLWHGEVVQAQLPTGSGFVDANRAKHIRYV